MVRLNYGKIPSHWYMFVKSGITGKQYLTLIGIKLLKISV